MAESKGVVQSGGSVSQTLKDAGFDKSVYTSKDAWEKVRSANNLDSNYTVYAGQTLDFSSLLGGESAASKASTPTTTAKTASASNPDEVDLALQTYQDEYKDRLDNLNESKLSSEEVEASVNEMMAEIEIPEPPKLTELYMELSETAGLNNINERLTALKNERAAIEDRLQARKAYIEGQPISMGAISGQTNEVTRQEQANLDYINRSIQVTVEEQQGALQYINTIVQLTGEDYSLALQHYTTVFDTKMKALSMINEAKQVEWSQEMELVKWEQSTASAQLAMWADRIADGTLFIDNLSDEQRMEIGRLEVQAGLPLGFLQNMQMDPAKQIQSISQYEGADGYVHSNIVRVDARTGEVTTEDIKLGKFYRAPRTPSTPSYSEQKQMALDKSASTVISAFEEFKGGDGNVSPKTYSRYKAAWVQDGGSSEDFDTRFGNYVNESYAYDVGNQYNLSQTYLQSARN